MCESWLRVNWWMAHFYKLREESFVQKRFLMRWKERGQGFFQGSSSVLVVDLIFIYLFYKILHAFYF